MTATVTTAPHTPYSLAEVAGCFAPDSPTSPGAVFLLGIAEHVADSRDDGEDAAAYIADAAVPVYTHDVWAAFVDLGAYREDPSELGDDGSDMTKSASLALYVVADRLASALLSEQAQR